MKRLLLYMLLMTICLTSNAQGLRAFIPDGAVSQFAGSIGFVSAGASYDLFRKSRGSLDLVYGYVPQSKGGELHIITTKFAYRPIEIKVKNIGSLYPANPGVFVSYHHGSQFGKWGKNQYPDGYYWWSKALRLHASLSTEAKFDAAKIFPKTKIRAIGLYSELNTNDLYAVSWFQNRDSMSFWEIIRVGYGVRLYF